MSTMDIWTICEHRLSTRVSVTASKRPGPIDNGRPARRVCASSNEPARGRRHAFAPLRMRSGALAGHGGCAAWSELIPHRAAHGANAPVLPRKQGRDRESAGDPLLANLAPRRVVDQSVSRTVGPEDPLSVGGVYEQRHATRRIPDPLSCGERLTAHI